MIRHEQVEKLFPFLIWQFPVLSRQQCTISCI